MQTYAKLWGTHTHTHTHTYTHTSTHRPTHTTWIKNCPQDGACCICFACASLAWSYFSPPAACIAVCVCVCACHVSVSHNPPAVCVSALRPSLQLDTCPVPHLTYVTTAGACCQQLWHTHTQTQTHTHTDMDLGRVPCL